MTIENPYRPGAAHSPPHLAGRDREQQEFARLLRQAPILENLVLTGIRGIGKTVLMREAFHQQAVAAGWLWVSSDISESVSVSEERLAQRLLTDLATFSGDWEYAARERPPLGFTGGGERHAIHFDYRTMLALFEQQPGLPADKVKHVLRVTWELMQKRMPKKKGIVFAWDEAQNLSDRSDDNQYPLGVLLDVFSSLQSQSVPFMLLLSGLPTLFPKLVESRTYTERMFRVVTLHNLNRDESRAAVAEPLANESKKMQRTFASLHDAIYRFTHGYPYFIQFWCRELYDYATTSPVTGKKQGMEILRRITRKLDTDFFEGRWVRLTNRQRDLLTVIAHLDNSGGEFSVQEIVARSKALAKSNATPAGRAFSGSLVSQMLAALLDRGMVFKNRHGSYTLAVPQLDEYIRRRMTA